MRYAVIAVTEGQAAANALSAIFDESDELDLVDLVDSAGDALHTVSRRECHVVLVDNAISWTSPYDIVREIQGRLPHIAVLIVDQTSNPQALEAAVDAGARGIVSLSESFEEVRRRILGAAQWSLKIRGMRADDDVMISGTSTIVAVVGSKGGVGATTIALHLARQQTLASKRVCLVDLDLTKGDVALYANIEPRRDVSDLVGLGEGLSIQAIQDVVYASKHGEHYLCAPRHPERGEQVSGDSIRTLLITLRQMYEYIYIDCGASPTDVLGSALEVADEVFVVVNQDLASIRGANRLIELCDRLSIRSADELTVVINKANRRSEIQGATIKRMLTAPLHPVEIGESPKDLEKATNSREPGLVRSKEFLGAIIQIVRSLIDVDNKLEQADEAQRRTRRFGPRSLRSEAGVVTVEFMVLFPMLMLIFVLCLQTVVYAGARVQASHGASAAATAAARGGDPDRAARDEVNDKFSDGLRVNSPRQEGSMVKVEVSVKVPSIVPSAFMGDGRVSVESSAVEER